jgi:predicted dehydrogenase
MCAAKSAGSSNTASALRSAAVHPPHRRAMTPTPARRAASTSYGVSPSITSSAGIKAPNIRLSKALGGGPVGDVGVYCLNAARYVTREAPIEVTAFVHQSADEPRFREVPQSVTFSLRFPSGALAHCDCGFDAAESRWLRVNGSTGYIELDRAFGYRGQQLGIGLPGKFEDVRLEPVDHFAAEMDHFAGCVLQNKEPMTPGEEGLADVLVSEAIHDAAATGRTVKLRR